MDSSLDLALSKARTALGCRIISYVNRCNVTVRIGIIADAGNEVSAHQSDLVAGEQTKILLRRLDHEVSPLDIQFSAKRNLTTSEIRILLVVRYIEHLDLAFRIVIYNNFDGIEYGHHPALLHLQILAYAVLEHSKV